MNDLWTTIVSCHNRSRRFVMNAPERIWACNIVPIRVIVLDWHLIKDSFGTNVIVFETRSWQIVSTEIDQTWSYRIQAQQIFSERIDSHHFVSGLQLHRNATIRCGFRKGSHDCGKAALHHFWLQFTCLWSSGYISTDFQTVLFDCIDVENTYSNNT